MLGYSLSICPSMSYQLVFSSFTVVSVRDDTKMLGDRAPAWNSSEKKSSHITRICREAAISTSSRGKLLSVHEFLVPTFLGTWALGREILVHLSARASWTFVMSMKGQQPGRLLIIDPMAKNC
jgi:hypothetical protein